jgi:hypothetical protein
LETNLEIMVKHNLILVVQKALQVTDGMRFLAIIHEIKSVVKILKQTSHGRKIYENIVTTYGDYFNNNSKADPRRKSFLTTGNIMFQDK